MSYELMVVDTLIWDWNGTLLDDVRICIDSINILLYERNLPLMKEDRYKDIFTFPVKEYYIKAGFDFSKEPFEIPAHQFIDQYRKALRSSVLHEGVKETLDMLRGQGYRQFILSAMEKDLLMENLGQHSLVEYFERIYGIEDHLGHSKTDVARKLIEENSIKLDQAVIIGDTLHDYEVSQELGIRCLLIANGHQSEARLKSAGCPVMRSLAEVVGYLVKT